MSAKDSQQDRNSIYAVYLSSLLYALRPKLEKGKKEYGQTIGLEPAQMEKKKKVQISLLLSCVWGEMIDNSQVRKLGPYPYYLLITDTQ